MAAKETAETVKFFSVFTRYCTYAGKERVQFESNEFVTSNKEVIEFFRTGKDKNVTEVKVPVVPRKPAEEK